MTPETMRHALSVEAEARKIKRHLDEYVLLKLDHASTEEVINVGDPVKYREGDYHRMKIRIPEATRRLAFRQWQKETTLKFNEYVRELAQLGVSTDLRLIKFTASDGGIQP